MLTIFCMMWLKQRYMQDWNYLAGQCMELTLELSQHKWPQPEQLPQLFEDNLPALLAFPMAGAYGGVW